MRELSIIHTGFIVVLLILLTAAPTYSQQEQPDAYNPADTEVVIAGDDTLQGVSEARELDFPTRRGTQVRQVPDSVVENLKANKAFEYANNPAFWKKEPPRDDSALIRFLDWLSKSALMKWILYLFLTAIIVFAIYQVMVVNDFFVFSRKKKKLTEETVAGEDFTSIDLDKHIAACIARREYRQAIRFLYLKTLKLLHDRRQIQLDAKFTNQDYVRQMQKKSGSGEFSRLTSFYEYAWYGEYQLSDQQFEHVHQNFNRFINKQ